MPGDAVVEQQTAGAQLALQEPEVGGVVLDANVLGQPDRGHRVETGFRDVAVVGVAHLRQVAEPLLVDAALRPLRLLGRQGGADRPHPAARRVAHHAAPAAADVEQPVARGQPQLVEDQPVLILLGLFQRRVGVRVHRAGVGHRRAQHQFVEPVGDVVVVVDGLGVAGLGVHQPVGDPTPPGARLLRRRGHRQQPLEPDRADDVGQHPGRRPLELHPIGQRLEQPVRITRMHAVGLQVAGHVGAGQAELARRRRQIRGPARTAQIQAQLGVFAAGGAAVVRGELQRVAAGRGEDLQNLGHAELAGPRPVRLFGGRHRRCTAFA